MASILTSATAGVMRTICSTAVAKAPFLGTSPLAQLRMMSCNKQKCVKNPPPRCCPDELKKTPCHEARQKCKDTSDPNCSPFKSMWENPECCLNPCPDVFPRFDELYYRMSDKECRKYQQTWNECPELVVRKKPLCCYEKICMPPFEKRPKLCRPKTACTKTEACKTKLGSACPKVQMPCCGMARNPPKCIKIRRPSCCTKVCCPYPSYSECCRDRPKKLRPIECKCLRVINTCEVYDYFRSKPWLLTRPSY